MPEQRTVSVRLRAQVAEYVAGMGVAGRASTEFARKTTTAMTQASASVRGLTGELNDAAAKGRLDAVASSMTQAGAVMAAGFAVAATAAARFEQQMSKVRAVAQASPSDMKRLSEAALQAGRDTKFSAVEAGKAQEELAKAGLSVNQILSGGMAGALSLAAAGDLDLAEAATTAAKALNTFELNAGQAGHVADVLAAGANKSATDVHELSMALRMGGVASNAFGVGMEETVGTLAAFAQSGLSGSDAGTSFKQMLLMLAAPTDKARGLMRELGIEAYDASGQFVGIAGLAGELQTGLAGLTQEQQQSALATIFGADAMRAANVLYKEGAQGISDWTAKVNDQGAAAETAAAKSDNLIGDIERLKSELENLFVTGGSGATDGLRTLVQGIDALVRGVSAIPAPILTAVTVVGGLTGAALLLGSAFLKVRGSAADVLGELRKVGPAGAKAADGLQRGGRWAARAGGAFAALQIASAVTNSIADTTVRVDALTASLKTYASSGKVSGELARVFGSDISRMAKDLKLASRSGSVKDLQVGKGIEDWIPFASNFEASYTQVLNRFQGLDQALTNMVNSGNGTAAAAEFAKLEAEAKKAGVSTELLASLFPGYSQAAKDATGASGGVASALAQTAAKAGLTTQEVEKLKTAFDELFDRQMTLDEALIKEKQSMVDLAGALRDGARTLNLNSEEGRKNREAILTRISAIKEMRDAQLANGASLDEANAKYVADIKALEAAAIKAGFNAREVRAMTAAYRGVPQHVKTIIQAETATAAAALQAFLARFRNQEITIRARAFVDPGTGDVVLPGRGRHKKDRWGGVHLRRARWGVLSDAEVYSTQSPGRYMIAEPETGGEAFVPRRGDRARSLSILGVAAGWYGQKVMPMARGGVVTHAAGGLVNTEPVSSTPRRATRLDFAESYSRALDTLTSLNSALKENGRSFRLSSAAGRENAQAVFAVIRGAQDAAKAKYDETGSVRLANQVYDQHITRLRKLLAQQKVNSATVQGLIRRYGGRPGYDNAAIAPANSLANIAYVKSAASAESGIADLSDKLSLTRPGVNLRTEEGRENLLAIIGALEAAGSSAQDRYTQTGNLKTAKALYATYVARIRKSLSANGYSAKLIDSLIASYGRITLTSNREGGVYMASSGLMSLRQPAMFSAGATPLYGFAEPGTGGELFVPRNGDKQRGRDLVSIAAGWYGGRYVPDRGGGPTQQITYSDTFNVVGGGAGNTVNELRAYQRERAARARIGLRR